MIQGLFQTMLHHVPGRRRSSTIRPSRPSDGGARRPTSLCRPRPSTRYHPSRSNSTVSLGPRRDSTLGPRRDSTLGPRPNSTSWRPNRRRALERKYGHWFPPRQRVRVTATDTVLYLEMLWEAVLVPLVGGPGAVGAAGPGGQHQLAPPVVGT